MEDCKQKFDYLRERVVRLADTFGEKARRHKKRVFRLRVTTAILSALVPVCLGLNLGTKFLPYQSNLALLLGAIVAVLATVEAFWGNKDVWIAYSITSTQLRNLLCRIDYSTCGVAVIEKDIDKWYEEFHSILEGMKDKWEDVQSGIEESTDKPLLDGDQNSELRAT